MVSQQSPKLKLLGVTNMGTPGQRSMSHAVESDHRLIFRLSAYRKTCMSRLYLLHTYGLSSCTTWTAL